MRISSLVGWGCAKIGQATRMITSPLVSLVSKVAQLSSQLLTPVTPSFISMNLWKISKANMRELNIVYFFSFTRYCLVSKILSFNTKNVIILVGVGANYVDAAWKFPFGREARIACDCLILLSTALSSLNAIAEGSDLLDSCWEEKENPVSTRIAQFISGNFLSICGAFYFSSCFNTGIDLINGIALFNALDSQQQSAVLKFKVIHQLGGPKSCNAMIIDDPTATIGLGGSVAEIYSECQTLTYLRIESGEELCQVLKNATVSFGAPLNLFVFNGHANSNGQVLGKNYFFTADPADQALDCMQRYLAENAQIFMLGCHTASTIGNQQPIAQRLALALPGKEVIGYDGGLNPYFTNQWFEKERFHFQTYWIRAWKKLDFSLTSAVTYFIPLNTTGIHQDNTPG